MPKEYNYQKRTFGPDELTGMLGAEAIEATTESFDEMVGRRDKGASRILSAYRSSVLGTKG